MIVRPVEPADRGEWIRMLLALHPGSETSDHAPDVDAFLEGREQRPASLVAVFVCERPGGGLAGFLELSVRDYAEGCEGPTPYVEGWYVDPDARRQGIGARLVAAAEAWSRAHGYAELASDALIDNRVSERAHRALGFQEVERSIHFRKPL